MKKFILLIVFLVPFFLTGCLFSNDDDEDDTDLTYAAYMRTFVQGISSYAKGIKPGFCVIPQNGAELLTEDMDPSGAPSSDYISAIDGQGQEDLFYGYNNDNEATPEADRSELMSYLDVAKAGGKKILVTDYCTTNSFIDNSYTQNFNAGYISFAAQSRELDMVATYPAVPYNKNTSNITSLALAKNFLYLINPDIPVKFANKQAFLSAIINTDYDAVIIDLFCYDDAADDDIALTSAEIASLKTKKSGGTRLVIAYMSIGEAEDYRYYWDESWLDNPPSWLVGENPEWEGNYKVRYWDPEWQAIIYGNDSSYLKKIINAGFDGVYLDIIDAFEYFQ